jgi:ATP-dependent DNA ligase
VLALDALGRPSFNILQNFGNAHASILFYAFDLPIFAGRDLQSELLDVRRELLRTKVLPTLDEPIRFSALASASS